MQSAVYCSPTTERAPSFVDHSRLACVTAATNAHLADSSDPAGYNPRRPDCAGNGSDVTTSSRGRRSPSSSSGQSADDVNACSRSTVSVDASSSYVDRGASDFNVLTAAHNGYTTCRPSSGP